MILVEVFVPSVDKTYDFQLNENVPAGMVIQEISEMVGQQEKTKIVGEVSKICLCSQEQERVMRRGRTLAEQGIVTGNRLILV